MAHLKLRVCWFAVTFLLCVPNAESQSKDAKTFINEAAQALALKMKTLENKLNLHNDRVMYILPKMQNMVKDVLSKSSELEPLPNMTSEIEHQIANIETMLLHEEERVNSTQKETNAALEDINTSIQTLTSAVENKFTGEVNHTGKDYIEGRLNATDLKLDDLKSQIENLTKNFNGESVRRICHSVIDMSPFERHIEAAEKLLQRYEMKLEEYRVNSENMTLDSRAEVDDKRHDEVVNELKRQGEEIAKVQNVLSDAKGVWMEMPKLSDLYELQASTNQTMDAVIRAIDNLNENIEASMVNLTTHLGEVSGVLAGINETVQRSVTEITNINIVINDITAGLSKLYGELEMKDHKLTEIVDGLGGNNKKIQTAADRVLAEVRQLIGQVGFSVTNTLNRKLGEIENSMGNKQFDSNKMIEKVIQEQLKRLWVQFGAIDRYLRENKESLHNLIEHTDTYTNSSINAMGEVSTEVKLISSRTQMIRDDLGGTLVKLRAATDEFTRMAGEQSDLILSLLNSKTDPGVERVHAE